jgi:hypothetical protein
VSRSKRKSRFSRKPKPNGAGKPNGGGPIVSVCVPSDDHVHAGFFMAFNQMMMHTMTAGESEVAAITVQHIGASILPHSRYMLVKNSLRLNPTHLLFIDSDMMFPPDMLTCLLRHGVDMVGINAMSRRPPYNTTAWISHGNRAVTTAESTGLEKAWRTGFAVVLIRAAVFEAMAPPYFNYEFVPEQDEFRGEDYVFFDRAKAAGFDLYIDHDMSKRVDHVGSFPFNPIMSQHAESLPWSKAAHQPVLEADR